ncbi:amidohydrolase [Streptomyces boluensis]|uniref:Amidohydrolase family protein n=1 Tax=Streptomyces boluensis TaxID=1775135 RepID=A0A964XNZ5_9ACTN|nr:amidohydrolase [Streptomyces boluensis]NBE56020.1 amidohydrolase family protein [Streptomyces boluensis]
MESSPRRRTVLAAAGATAVAVTVTEGCSPPGEEHDRPADLVLKNGYVYTVDDQNSVHQALAVTGGRITYVGNTKGVAPHIGKGTKVVDLKGRMVMPGLHDGHLHPMDGGQALLGCDLDYESLTVKQFQDRIQAYIDKTKNSEPDAWVQVNHWYAQAMRPAGTKLTKADLDKLDTKRPIMVQSTDGHTLLLNSRALEIAGITAKTKDPTGGKIGHGEDGEPNGLLEDGADKLVRSKLPEPTTKDHVKVARRALTALAEQGVTTFMDAFSDENALRAFTTLAEQGELTARPHFAPVVEVSAKDPVKELHRLRRRYHAGRTETRPAVAVHNAKLFLDGVLQHPAQTAALLEPYLVHKHNDWVHGKKKGEHYWEPEKLNNTVHKLAKAGFDPHIHAIGDRAVRTALDAFAHLREQGDQDTRPTVAHAELVNPKDVPRFGRLNVCAAMGFHWAKPAPDSVDSVKPYLGAKRWSHYEPEGDINHHHGRITLGSDWPVDPLDEWTAIKTVITRTATPDSPYAKQGPMTPHQRLTRAAALRAATLNGAYQLRQEKETGSLEKGKLADLIVLDRNVVKVPSEEIAQTKVLLTVVGGKVVHGSTRLD